MLAGHVSQTVVCELLVVLLVVLLDFIYFNSKNITGINQGKGERCFSGVGMISIQLRHNFLHSKSKIRFSNDSSRGINL